MNRLHLFLISLLVSTVACTNAEIGQSKDVASDAIYADYSVQSEEGNDKVTVLLQYRMGGSEGTSLVLDSPASVSFDGQVLTADSAGISGAYYEAVRPSNGFEGKHLIGYTSSNGKVHRQEFHFQPLQLLKELPKKLPRDTFQLQFAQRHVSNATAHLFITDTAFSTNDVNLKLPLSNGALAITSEMLQPLTAGPIVLEVFIEEVTPLSSFSREGGKLTIEYGLKRESILLPSNTKRN